MLPIRGVVDVHRHRRIKIGCFESKRVGAPPFHDLREELFRMLVIVLLFLHFRDLRLVVPRRPLDLRFHASEILRT